MVRGEHIPDTIEAPPFLRTWPRVYGAVLGYLAALVALLYAVGRAFHY
jgi:hypothetical protein